MIQPTVLVTGGTGFVGSHLARRLSREGHDVVVTGTAIENRSIWPIIPLNLDNPDWPFESNGVVEKIDVCFHLAANNDTLEGDWSKMFRANCVAPLKLFQQLHERHGCHNFVYASSCAVYGNSPVPYKENGGFQPTSPYAVSKLAFDELVKKFVRDTHSKVVGLRYSNVYGPDERHKGRRASMIHQMCETLKAGDQIKLFKDGSQKRDWVHVEDVVEANVLAMNAPSGVYNVGSGENIQFIELAELIREELSVQDLRGIKWIDCPMGDAYQKETLADLTLAGEKLGYRPKWSIREGVKHFIKQMKTK